MGITTKTVTECTCDICRKPCDKNDGKIQIMVNSGDGRDVGPAYINGLLFFDAPYQCAAGVVCKECKIKWLALYLDHLRIAR